MIRHPLRSLAIVGLLALIGLGIGVAGAYVWASYHLQAARAALQRYHTSEAVTHLRAALTIWPRDAETLLLAARAARRAGVLDDAARCLERCQPLLGKNDKDFILESTLLRVERGELDDTKKFRDALVTRDDPAVPLVLEAWARGCLRMYRSSDADKLF
jgi:cytochrome c-type biogenesis protein CcmH/NrfG